MHCTVKPVAKIWLQDATKWTTIFQHFRINTSADIEVILSCMSARHTLKSLCISKIPVDFSVRDGLTAGGRETHMTQNSGRINTTVATPSGRGWGLPLPNNILKKDLFLFLLLLFFSCTLECFIWMTVLKTRLIVNEKFSLTYVNLVREKNLFHSWNLLRVHLVREKKKLFHSWSLLGVHLIREKTNSSILEIY